MPFALAAQRTKPPEQEPPEEDEALKAPKEYTFNPLQAESEMKVGAYYLKKGSYKAAARRYEEATKWNPSFGEAFLRWGEALEKFGDRKGAKAAYAKFLELAPEAKEAKAVRKKIERM